MPTPPCLVENRLLKNLQFYTLGDSHTITRRKCYTDYIRLRQLQTLYTVFNEPFSDTVASAEETHHPTRHNQHGHTLLEHNMPNLAAPISIQAASACAVGTWLCAIAELKTALASLSGSRVAQAGLKLAM